MSERKETRVMARSGARELSEEELTVINGAGAPCQVTFSHLSGAAQTRIRNDRIRREYFQSTIQCPWINA